MAKVEIWIEAEQWEAEWVCGFVRDPAFFEPDALEVGCREADWASAAGHVGWAPAAPLRRSIEAHGIRVITPRTRPGGYPRRNLSEQPHVPGS